VKTFMDMMARANHLYLLLVSLLLMISSQIGTAGRPVWIRRAVAGGKILLTVSALLLAVAVFTDHDGSLALPCTYVHNLVLID
jgi:hypothetical protein